MGALELLDERFFSGATYSGYYFLGKIGNKILWECQNSGSFLNKKNYKPSNHIKSNLTCANGWEVAESIEEILDLKPNISLCM